MKPSRCYGNRTWAACLQISLYVSTATTVDRWRGGGGTEEWVGGSAGCIVYALEFTRPQTILSSFNLRTIIRDKVWVQTRFHTLFLFRTQIGDRLGYACSSKHQTSPLLTQHSLLNDRRFSFYSKKDNECMHLQELQYFSLEAFENLLACKSVGL